MSCINSSSLRKINNKFSLILLIIDQIYINLLNKVKIKSIHIKILNEHKKLIYTFFVEYLFILYDN